MKKSFRFAPALILTCFLSPMTFASYFPVPDSSTTGDFQQPVIIPKREPKNAAEAAALYTQEIKEKLATGVTNTLVGWTDILAEPEKAVDKKESVMKGIGKGIVDAVLNTLGGVLQIATFPFPGVNIPIPDKGVET